MKPISPRYESLPVCSSFYYIRFKNIMVKTISSVTSPEQLPLRLILNSALLPVKTSSSFCVEIKKPKKYVALCFWSIRSCCSPLTSCRWCNGQMSFPWTTQDSSYILKLSYKKHSCDLKKCLVFTFLSRVCPLIV